MDITSPKKIYVASSWRNTRFDDIVGGLRDSGHEVFDFKNPAAGEQGFHWSDIDPNWPSWTMSDYQASLKHPTVENSFKKDFAAMQWADTFLLVLPCGRSAHLELGWACVAGKKTLVLLDSKVEPELMIKVADHICESLTEVVKILKK